MLRPCDKSLARTLEAVGLVRRPRPELDLLDAQDPAPVGLVLQGLSEHPLRLMAPPHLASCRAPTARQGGNAPPKGIGRTRLDGAPRLNTLRLGEVDGLRQSRRRPNGIKIECSDASMAEDLAEFLRGLCLEAAVTSGRTLEARFREPIPVDDAAARLQLDLYLRVWEAINCQASAVRLSD